MVSSSGSRMGRMLRIDCRIGSIAAATAVQSITHAVSWQCTHWRFVV